MGQSLAEQIAMLPQAEQDAILADLDMDSLVWDWSFFGRPEQIPPTNFDWDVWLYLAGRGSGKSRAASEWLREQAKDTTQGTKRFLIVGRTAADVRDVQILGDSGILAVSPPSERPTFHPSNRELVWPNGNLAVLRTADEPEGIRGIQAHGALCDELAAWRVMSNPGELSGWDQVRIATRLGDHPQIVATTTPKRTPVIIDLVKDAKENPKIHITRGSTFDNRSNLAGTYLDAISGVYDGTALAKQELYGELLEAVEGAMWDEAVIDAAREMSYPPMTPLRVIGVDPSVAENPRDKCGIVVCASTAQADLYKRTAWVLEDATIEGSPTLWAQKVVDMARKWGCPVVAEVNQGGALVRNAIHQIDPTVTVLEVHSKVGKKLRAEPITLAYQQGRVHHIGRETMMDLEDEMITWDPETAKKSPDRVDALVHALTALLISPPKGFSGQKVRAHSMADRQINLNRTKNFPGIQKSGFRIL